jgi:hypothetical protein
LSTEFFYGKGNIMKARLIKSVVTAFAVLSVLVSQSATAQNTINYQGYLTDSPGNPVNYPSGIDMRFSLWDSETGGTELWSEVQSVVVNQGVYSVALGSVTAFPPSVDFTGIYYLQVEIDDGAGGWELFSGRQELTHVPYAINADTVDGKHAADFADSGANSDITSLNGLTTPLSVAQGGTGAATSAGALSNLGAAAASHTHDGADITSGTVAEPLIDPLISRDSEIMPTVLSGDGSGSGLDADKLDGQDSTAFAASLHNHDSTYVNVTGDTMTGTLFLPPNGLVAGTNQLVLSGGSVGIGTSSPSAQLHVEGVAGALFTGTYGSGTIPVEGAGTRLMWYPGKAAFRAGKVTGTEWDDGSVGDYSISAGIDTIAWGYGSTAFGDSAKAYGHQSTAIGQNAQASGTGSTALGVNTVSVGDYSTVFGAGTRTDGNYSMAMGQDTTAETYNEIVMGRYNTLRNPATSSLFNWNGADRLFVIGNGTSTTSRSDAMVILKNGNTGIGTVGASAPAARLHVANPIIDNTPGKHTLYLTESNNTESPTSGLDTSKPYYGIGFRRAWNTNDMSNIKNIAGIYAYGVQGYRGGLVFKTENAVTADNPDTVAMVIRPDGNVGIGTTAPAAGLDVGGTTKLGTSGTIIRGVQAPNTTGGKKVYSINFPNSFKYTPSVTLTVKNSGAYTDVFAVSTTNVTSTGFDVILYRVDVPGGSWGQTPNLDWVAIEP